MNLEPDRKPTAASIDSPGDLTTLPLPQFFDRDAEWFVVERRLPHWSQAGTMCFITWRMWDSLPREVLNRWLADRANWLRRHGINPECRDLRTNIATLPRTTQREYRQLVTQRWERNLDECHGSCLLKRPELSQVVADSLEYFDGERYALADYVVMPNHVHLLASFEGEHEMLGQCASWKHYTAAAINRQIGRTGRFWQTDDFDHLVRGPEQFEWLRKYIADNPYRAGLRPGEYRLRRQSSPLAPRVDGATPGAAIVQTQTSETQK